jgi:saccharopine dehydrogenase-like NADP-dependent oxidoreductase
MEIAVLGGAGGIGSAVVLDLLASSDARVRIVDIREEEAKEFAEGLGNRVKVAVADAGRPRTLVRALEGASACVNCIGPFYRFAVMVARAALDAGVNGVDICDDYTPVGGLMALDELARQRNLRYVTGVGWSPGITNLLALKGADRMDRVERVDIRWAGSVADVTGPAAIKHLLFTSTGDVPTYRDGRRTRVEALSEPEEVKFPYPLGKVEVSHCGHPEPLTLPRYMDVPSVSVKGGLIPGWNNSAVKMAVKLGLTRDDQSIDGTAKYIHRLERLIRLGGVLRSGARVEVVGRKGPDRLRVVSTVLDRMTRLTALPASVAVLMLARGGVADPGVYAPEGCLDPGEFFTDLARRGIVVPEEEHGE